MILLVLLIGSGNGKLASEREREVDLIELNHKYSEEGQHQYDQIIFWQWSPVFRRYDAVGWILIDEKNGLCGYPVLTAGFWRCKFRIHTGQGREYRSKMFRETITCVDPERENVKLQIDDKPLRSVLE